MLDPESAKGTATIHRRLAGTHNHLARTDAELIAMQVAISQIAAPTGGEGERAAWIARRFEELGLNDVDCDAAGNVIGRRPGRRPGRSIAICAHLDTVFPSGTDLSVRREGERLIGPGITDNGRGLAVLLRLAAAIDGQHITTGHQIEFVATTGEEGAGDLRGAKHYFATRGADTRAAIIVDGAGDERIVHRALGSRRFRVRFDGPGGHSWSAFGAPNAIHAATSAATAIANMPLPRQPRTTLTVSRIGGGLSVNSIPGEAWMEIDLRSSSAAILASMSGRIERVAREAAVTENQRSTSGSGELRCRIDVIGDRPCGEIPEHDPLIRIALDATRLIGRTPDLAMASTDANVPIALGIPAVAIGAGGRGGDTHSLGEWYDNTAGSLGVARALTTIVAAAE